MGYTRQVDTQSTEETEGVGEDNAEYVSLQATPNTIENAQGQLNEKLNATATNVPEAYPDPNEAPGDFMRVYEERRSYFKNCSEEAIGDSVSNETCLQPGGYHPAFLRRAVPYLADLPKGGRDQMGSGLVRAIGCQLQCAKLALDTVEGSADPIVAAADFTLTTGGMDLKTARAKLQEDQEALLEITSGLNEDSAKAGLLDEDLSTELTFRLLAGMEPEAGIAWFKEKMAVIDDNNRQSHSEEEAYLNLARSAMTGLMMKINPLQTSDPERYNRLASELNEAAMGEFTWSGEDMDRDVRAGLCDLSRSLSDSVSNLGPTALAEYERTSGTPSPLRLLAQETAQNALDRLGELEEKVDGELYALIQGELNDLVAEVKGLGSPLEGVNKACGKAYYFGKFIESGCKNIQCADPSFTETAQNGMAEYTNKSLAEFGGYKDLLVSEDLTEAQKAALRQRQEIDDIENSKLVEVAGEVVALVAVGVLGGMATAGLSILPMMAANGALLTGMDALINPRGFDSTGEAIEYYVQQFAVNAASAGLGRAGEAIGKIAQLGGYTWEEATAIFKAAQKGGPEWQILRAQINQNTSSAALLSSLGIETYVGTAGGISLDVLADYMRDGDLTVDDVEHILLSNTMMLGITLGTHTANEVYAANQAYPKRSNAEAQIRELEPTQLMRPTEDPSLPVEGERIRTRDGYVLPPGYTRANLELNDLGQPQITPEMIPTLRYVEYTSGGKEYFFLDANNPGYQAFLARCKKMTKDLNISLEKRVAESGLSDRIHLVTGRTSKNKIGDKIGVKFLIRPILGLSHEPKGVVERFEMSSEVNEFMVHVDADAELSTVRVWIDPKDAEAESFRVRVRDSIIERVRGSEGNPINETDELAAVLVAALSDALESRQWNNL